MLNVEKLENLILYLSSHPRVKSLGVTKLYKLIYFSDVMHLRDFGHTITGSDYIKYPQGPVPSKGQKTLKNLEKSNRLEEKRVVLSVTHELRALRSLTEPKVEIFSRDELQSIDAVCERLGHLPAGTLSEMSHLEPAWVCAKDLDKLDPKLMMYGSEEDVVGL